nr:immunoglobulin light chain junction region [Macaca mulatta]
RQQYSRSPFTF